MRLLILTAAYPWKNSIAGVFHTHQFRLIAASGIDLTVVCPTPWAPGWFTKITPRWNKYGKLPLVENEEGFVIYRPRYFTIPREHIYFKPHYFQYLAVKALHLSRPDLIHAYYALPCGATARLLSRFWDIPYITGMLGDDITVLPYLRKSNHELLQDVLSGSALSIAQGPTLAAEAMKLTDCNIMSLSLGVDEQRFLNLPRREEARSKLSLPLDRTIVLYVGNLLKEKGIPELANAFKKLDRSNVLGVFVGDGPERNVLDGYPAILAAGLKPHHMIPTYLAAADIFILPSHHEGLPTSMIEAGLANLPVIGTSVGGNIDLLSDNRGWLIPVKSEADIMKAIDEVIDNPEQAKQRALKLNHFVNENHTVKKNTMQLLNYYKQVVSGNIIEYK